MKKKTISFIYFITILFILIGCNDHQLQEEELLTNVHEVIEKRLEKKTSDVEQFRKPLEITIAFAGDVMMEASIDRAMKKHGFDYPFLQVREDIEKADYAIVNLETAVTNQAKSYDKQFNFKTGPESLVALKEAGLDMVSLANNHTMDYREEGLVDTINYLNEVGLAHVGAGRNKDEAFASHTIELKGKKISFLGFSRVLPSLNWYATDSKPGIASGYQLDQMVRTIEKEKKEVDYLESTE